MQLRRSQWGGMEKAARERRRWTILAASYAALAAIGLLAWVTVPVHVGALAVIPILFISYYLRPWAALTTAFFSGIALSLDEQARIAYTHAMDIPPLFSGLVLSFALCTVVLVTNRLRETAAANQLLQGRLLKARRAAEHDPLTGIANRTQFLRALGESMSRAGQGARIALLFCDLDGFKAVNDTYGHLVGDRVLQLAAGRLVNTVRAIDLVARLGGDEFAVLAERLQENDEAVHMALNIERAFKDPFQSEGKRYTVGITVGISVFPDDGTEPESLLRIADARMYRAKEAKQEGHIPY